MKKNKKYVMILMLAILSLVVVILFLNRKHNEVRPTIKFIENWQVREEPLDTKEAFTVINGEGWKITTNPETIDISLPGNYSFTVTLTKGKESISTGATLVVTIEEPTNHEHTFGSLLNYEGWSNWTVIKEATCTEDGIKERSRTCNDCGFVEKQTEVIAATGHKYDNGTITKAPTCTEPGLKVFTCTKCKEKKQETINALGHNWSSWNTIKQATCTSEGKETRSCSRCNLTETKTITALGHSYGNWIVTVQATCTQGGSREKVCSNCNHKIVETLNPLGHNWSDWVITQQPTCTSEGNRTRTCSRCNEIDSEKIMPLGHNWTDWEITQAETCTTSGSKKRTCSRCSLVETKTISPHPHNLTYDYGATTDQILAYRYECLQCGWTTAEHAWNNTAWNEYYAHLTQSGCQIGFKLCEKRYPKCLECGQIFTDLPPGWACAIFD